MQTNDTKGSFNGQATGSREHWPTQKSPHAGLCTRRHDYRLNGRPARLQYTAKSRLKAAGAEYDTLIVYVGFCFLLITVVDIRSRDFRGSRF
ncbi:uncharacterized protein ARMOST_07690 [Armillaria ostoyae]|uniref:Uncharacterized protein n=1 Tax=Armillaria ostoyae TaxID=47428 RepID=A0A284R6K8_ARMOS|nr:uncharacterized protein ARMOST_07690 [Armillaria ostoyae]